MNYKFAALTIAAAFAALTGAVHAQQTPQYGRDSVYAAPNRTSSEARTPVVAIPYGRDSIYASQLPQPSSSTATTANAAWPQRQGRDTVYAVPFQNGSAQPTSTAHGTSATEGKGG